MIRKGQQAGKRIARDELFMQAAYLFAGRGTCPRAQVGCVIVQGGRIVSQGYNGAPPGMPHCTEVGCGGGVPLDHPGEDYEFPNGCTRVIHAEVNAIYFAAAHGIPLEGTRLFGTHEPCLNCAKAIIGAHIESVVYKEPYRIHDGLELLKEAKIPTVKYMSKGGEVNVKSGLVHKAEIRDYEGYIIANVDAEGKLTEIFLHGWGKQGSTTEGWVQMFSLLFSEALQNGADFSHLARVIAHTKFEPYGETGNPEIPKCHSVPDYVMKWLAHRFGDAKLLNELAKIDRELDKA